MRVLSIVMPVFAIAAIGYIFAWRRLFSKEDVRGISRYVFRVAIPIMLFDAMANIDQTQLDLRFLLSYYAGTVLIYVCAVVLGRRLFHYGQEQLGAFGIGASFSNTVLIGLPVVDAAFGEAGVTPLLIIISVHAASLYFLAILTAEGSDSGHGALMVSTGRTFRSLLRNPIIVGLALGLAANGLSFRIPGALATTISLIRGSAIPVALFVLGATLHQFQLSGHLGEASLTVILKLVAHPLLVWLLAFPLFQVDPVWGRVAVLTAAMPVGINAYVFAAIYDVHLPQAATSILISTMLSIATLSMLLLLFL